MSEGEMDVRDTARLSEAQIAEIRARLDKGLPSPWLGDEARHAFIDAAPDDVRALLNEAAALKAERDTLLEAAARYENAECVTCGADLLSAQATDAALVALRAKYEELQEAERLLFIDHQEIASDRAALRAQVEQRAQRFFDDHGEVDTEYVAAELRALLASQPGPATSQEPSK